MNRNEHFYISIDFDGTVVPANGPNGVGQPLPHCIRVLNRLVDAGHKLILSTMRPSGESLDEAIRLFADNRVPLYGININPTQTRWTDSPKVYANMYIGDDALGCPLMRNADISPRPFVDWEKVEELLEYEGLFTSTVESLYPYPKF